MKREDEGDNFCITFAFELCGFKFDMSEYKTLEQFFTGFMTIYSYIYCPIFVQRMIALKEAIIDT